MSGARTQGLFRRRLALACATSWAHRPSRPSRRSGHSARFSKPRASCDVLGTASRLSTAAATRLAWHSASAICLPLRHADRLRGNLTGAPWIARAHEIVGLKCQHSGFELQACLAAAGCVQRLLEKAVGLREVSCRRGCQTLAETREHEPVRDCRLSGDAGDLIGVSRRRSVSSRNQASSTA